MEELQKSTAQMRKSVNRKSGKKKAILKQP